MVGARNFDFPYVFLRVELKMGPHFPAKSAEIIVLYSIFGPLVNRIHYFPPDPLLSTDLAETQHAVQNRPWVPHAGGQDDGSLHKLPQTSVTCPQRAVPQHQWGAENPGKNTDL